MAFTLRVRELHALFPLGLGTAQCKMLLFCVKTDVRESGRFELASLKKEEENRFGGLSGAVLSQWFFATLEVFLATKMNGQLS